MRVLVTGSEGFIGRHLIKKLWDHDGVENIYGIDNNSTSNPWQIGSMPYRQKTKIYLWKGDVRKQIFWNEGPVDCIIHLAGLAGVQSSFENFSKYASNNVLGTMKMLEFCKSIECKHFLFASSSSVYGGGEKTLSPYAEMKRTCENLVEMFCTKNNIRFLNMRFFNVFGPGQHNSKAVIPTWIRAALANQPILVNGDPDSIRRDFTYVEDLAEAIIACIDFVRHPRFSVEHSDGKITVVDKTTMDIANGVPISLTTVYTSIERILAKKLKVVQKKRREGDIQYSCARESFSEYGLEFKESFFSGLVKTIESMRK